MFKKYLNIWFWGSTIFVLLVVLPILNIAWHLFQPNGEIWLHLRTHLLKNYIVASFILVFFTVILTAMLSVILAWLVNAYDFQGKNFLSWALILPLSIPPYIGAYSYAGMLSYSGWLRVTFRELWQVDLNIPIMSMGGAIFIFTMFLFPYTYLITKSFWNKQSASMIESSTMLGLSPLKNFIWLVVPLSRVALVSGSTLIALEVLSDYGVVSYYGIPTFSAAIFKSWTSFNDIQSALKLSVFLLFVVILILGTEKISKGKRKYSYSNSKINPLQSKKLKGSKAILVSGFTWLIFIFSFVIPFTQLLIWSFISYKNIFYTNFFSMMINSFLLATLVAFLTVFASLLIANFNRLFSGFIAEFFSYIAVIGYAIPGTILAIAVIILLVDLDINKGIYFYVALVIALLIRYLAVSYQSVFNGFEKNGKTFLEASRTLGKNISFTFWHIDIPMLWSAISAGFAFVFLDVMKELPIVLLLRPFNFYTLSTKVFDYANDEMIPESSLPSLTIILMSMFVMYITSQIEKRQQILP